MATGQQFLLRWSKNLLSALLISVCEPCDNNPVGSECRRHLGPSGRRVWKPFAQIPSGEENFGLCYRRMGDELSSARRFIELDEPGIYRRLQFLSEAK